jgi:phosphoglycerol transferase MdoB-like AlkP superfamily enzyme
MKTITQWLLEGQESTSTMNRKYKRKNKALWLNQDFNGGDKKVSEAEYLIALLSVVLVASYLLCEFC